MGTIVVAQFFRDGNNLCTLSEEKVTRNKNEYGFPRSSINEALKYLNLKKEDIDFVAVSTKYLPPKYFYVKEILHLTFLIILKNKMNIGIQLFIKTKSKIFKSFQKNY